MFRTHRRKGYRDSIVLYDPPSCATNGGRGRDLDCPFVSVSFATGSEKPTIQVEDESIRYDKIVLVIGEVLWDPTGHRSRGKVLFNGIGRPSTMLIPLGTRSLLGRLRH